jgi:hypothetical protein
VVLRQLEGAITFCSMYNLWGGNYPANVCAIRTPGLPRRVVNGLITVPALYLTLRHYPQARLFALVALGRNHGRAVVKAMESDREAVVQIAIRDRSLKLACSTCKDCD